MSSHQKGQTRQTHAPRLDPWPPAVHLPPGLSLTLATNSAPQQDAQHAPQGAPTLHALPRVTPYPITCPSAGRVPRHEQRGHDGAHRRAALIHQAHRPTQCIGKHKGAQERGVGVPGYEVSGAPPGAVTALRGVAPLDRG